jgi:hypothetical protein
MVLNMKIFQVDDMFKAARIKKKCIWGITVLQNIGIL